MAVVYTHEFQIKTDSFDITGEMEFNLDGEVSYKTEDPIAGLKLKESQRMHALFAELKRIFDECGGIDKIKVTKKD